MESETSVTFFLRKEGNVVCEVLPRVCIILSFVQDNWYFRMYSIGDVPAATLVPL